MSWMHALFMLAVLCVGITYMAMAIYIALALLF